MAQRYEHVLHHLDRLLENQSTQDLVERLSPKGPSLSPRVPGGSRVSSIALDRRWQLINPSCRPALLDAETLAQAEAYAGNIENFIGTVKVPVGLAGPLKVNGLFAQGDYYLPLATTEAALVASYSRGAQLLSAAGGCTTALLSEGVSRAPGFVFESVSQVGLFVAWCLKNLETFRQVAEKTTRHGKMIDMRVNVEGNHVYLVFEYLTGDAAGQNMVTIATHEVCRHIAAHSPIQPTQSFIEANLSGDKKASAQSFQSVRGKKVTAEIRLSAPLLKKYLHTTPQTMVKYWNLSAMGGVLSGTIGVHGHYANGLAALYLATGQDVACVAESAVGVTRLEMDGSDTLYASVTLPNLIVGTVGGGTKLPSQNAALRILGLEGTGGAQAFAEVCAAAALAGELSIKGAICSDEFTRAHAKLARKHALK